MSPKQLDTLYKLIDFDCYVLCETLEEQRFFMDLVHDAGIKGDSTIESCIFIDGDDCWHMLGDYSGGEIHGYCGDPYDQIVVPLEEALERLGLVATGMDMLEDVPDASEFFAYV